jgi:outer membrane protein TolC
MTRCLGAKWILCALTLLVMAELSLCGCSRAWYRKAADRDAECLLQSRQFDSRWDIPDRVVEADPRSRLADSHDPDCGPLPPDDPAANCYMKKPYHSKRKIEYWDRRGTGGKVDAEQWLQYLPYNEDGEVVLTKELAVDLALLHSRDFQTQVEQLYLEALSLSQSRFAFNVQWAGGTGTSIALDGAEGTPRTISNPSSLSASRNFAAGGQFVADLLNSVTYQIGGGQSNFATGNLLFRLTQPLLRNAFRHVRTEGLTQSERSLLYSVRDFARFRRQFYLRIVQQYLNLLSQSQRIRIEEENVRNLEQNLDFHQLKYRQGTFAQIQVDLIFQNKQNGRISLIQARQALQAAQDQFKFELGLPAKVKIKLDESLLEPFKLNSDEVEELQAEADKLAETLRKYVPPDEAPKEFISESFAKLKELQKVAAELRPTVLEELKPWEASIKSGRSKSDIGLDEKDELDFQDVLATRIRADIESLKGDLETTLKKIDTNEKAAKATREGTSDIDKPVPQFNPSDPEAPPSPDQAEIVELLSTLGTEEKITPAVRAYYQLVASIAELQRDISRLFVAQTQIRLFLIDITPVEIDEDTAVKIALRNRLDLMNDKARVVDSYRSVEIAADQLESDLNLTASANLRTDPGRDNGIRFDGESSRYSVGLQFDGPLNRFAERNSYRAAQIAYQQQRRSYMAAEDSIVNGIRADLRSLTQSRFSFQTSRQQLIAAARQVDQARDRVQNSREAGDSSVTQDLLNSLTSLRNARNGLISSWLNYEVARIGLFTDLELLLLDENGRWINEDEKLDYSEESVEQLLPEKEGLDEVPDEPNSGQNEIESQVDSDTILDNRSSEPNDIELDLDLSEPPTPDLPELDSIDRSLINGNESSQTTWSGRATGATRSSSRRYSAGSILRRQ